MKPEALAATIRKVRGKSKAEQAQPATLAKALAVVRSASKQPAAPPKKPAAAPVASGRKWWERR